MLNQREIFNFEIESLPRTADGTGAIYRTNWVLHPECPYLDGHFPNQPMMPAVATIDGSIELLRQALHLPDLQPRAVVNAKFMAPITPGLKIEISLLPASDSKWNADWVTTTSTGETRLLARVCLQL